MPSDNGQKNNEIDHLNDYQKRLIRIGEMTDKEVSGFSQDELEALDKQDITKTCGNCRHYRRKIQRCSRDPNINAKKYLDDLAIPTIHNHCEWESLYPIPKKDFDLMKEVQTRNFSLSQRKFLKLLIGQFIHIAVFDEQISNLPCKKIKNVIKLFGEHLTYKMIC